MSRCTKCYTRQMRSFGSDLNKRYENIGGKSIKDGVCVDIGGYILVWL